MIYFTRDGIWELDEDGHRRRLTETATQDVDDRFWQSEQERRKFTARAASSRSSVYFTAIFVILAVFALWGTAVYFEVMR